MQKPHIRQVYHNSGPHFSVVLLCTYNPSSEPISTFKEIHQMFKPELYVLYFYLSSQHETFSNHTTHFYYFLAYRAWIRASMLSSCNNHYRRRRRRHRYHHQCLQLRKNQYQKSRYKKCLISEDECRRQDHFHIHYVIPTLCTTFLLIIGPTCFGHSLAIGRELIRLCSLYVNSSGRSFYIQYTIKIIIKTWLKYWNP
jgi:hypothetical protein